MLTPHHVSILAAALAVVAPCAPGQDDKRPVSGTVTDADGKPLADAKVSTFWIFDKETPQATNAMVTDENGRFEGRIYAGLNKVGLIAFSSDFESAGLVVTDRDAASDLKITCEPSVRVHGSVTCSELGRPPAWFNTYWNIGRVRLARCSSYDAKFDLRLPPGRYTWRAYDADADKQGLVSLDADERDVDLGAIDLPAGFVGKHEGKPMPSWSVTDARGVEPDKAQIANFRGKWVLIEFWGFW